MVDTVCYISMIYTLICLAPLPLVQYITHKSIARFFLLYSSAQVKYYGEIRYEILNR